MSTFVFASVSTDTDKRQGRTVDDGGRGYVHDFAMIYCTLSGYAPCRSVLENGRTVMARVMT